MITTIGDILRNKRLERGLSLEKISNDIFIKVIYLEALENNQHELLPSDVQGKGFLRLYAKYLGLSVEQLLNSWQTNEVKEEVNKPSGVNQGVASGIFDGGDVYLDEFETDPGSGTLIWNANSDQELSGITGSQRIFIEIGKELKSQREKLSISLFDVEKYTRIKQNQINALENGRFDLLPSPVQARGMINIYAGFLQADSEKLLLRFAEGLQAQLAEKKGLDNYQQGSPAGPIKPPAGWRKLFTLDLVIGSTIILFLLLFSIWGLIQITSSGNKSMDIDAPNIVEMLQVTASVVPVESSEELPSSSLETAVDQTGNEDNIPAEVVSDVVTETVPAVDNSPIQLYIVALQRAYMKVVVDSDTRFEGRVVPGNVYQFSGNDLIELTTGNAAALQVFHNQNNMGSLGFVGEVVKLQFTITGVITPTPMFTATSTATPIATVTLQPTPTSVTPTPSITPIAP